MEISTLPVAVQPQPGQQQVNIPKCVVVTGTLFYDANISYNAVLNSVFCVGVARIHGIGASIALVLLEAGYAVCALDHVPLESSKTGTRTTTNPFENNEKRFHQDTPGIRCGNLEPMLTASC